MWKEGCRRSAAALPRPEQQGPRPGLLPGRYQRRAVVSNDDDDDDDDVFVGNLPYWKVPPFLFSVEAEARVLHSALFELGK